MKGILAGISIMFFVFGYHAQDVEFSQFYASRVYLNPAFAGLKGDNSFTTTYRNQWPGIQNAYDSYFMSFERKMKQHNAGLSLYYIGDIAGEGNLRRQAFTFVYAKQVRFSKNFHGSFGLKAGYNINSINWSNLTWGDMIDARQGFVYSSNQPRGNNSEQFFDAGGGAIFYTDKLYGGIALEHLNRPKFGMLQLYDDSRLPVRYKVHFGANIPVSYMPNASQFNVAPQIIYTRQGTAQQFVVGSYVILNKFSLGVWHRVKESMIFNAGVEHDQFRFGYSYDLGTNKLMAYTGGAHELSLTYVFDFYNKEKVKKFRVLHCPSF